MLWVIPPGLLLIAGAFVVPLLPGAWRKTYMTLLPLAGLWALAGAQPGTFYSFNFFAYELSPVRIDGLSLIFGYIFLQEKITYKIIVALIAVLISTYLIEKSKKAKSS